MTLTNCKKTLALIGITAILLPSIFLSFPQKAKAVVPVSDASSLGELIGIGGLLGDIFSTASSIYSTASDILKSTAALEIKEYVLDPALKAIARSFLRSFTDSIVEWIRSGFQGSPLFITDFEAYLTDAADQATGRFMKEFLSPGVYNFICSPWRMQLALGLKRRYGYAERMRCTLSTVLNNAENFYTNLDQGNWDDWFAVTMNPSNNYHGQFITSLEWLYTEQNRAVERAEKESIANQGFLSMKKCVEYYPLDPYEVDQGVQPTCRRHEITSPGKWIQTQLSEATGIDFHEIALADEINEIISALIETLIETMLSTVLQKGIR